MSIISGQDLIDTAKQMQEFLGDKNGHTRVYAYIIQKTNHFTENIGLDAPLDEITEAIKTIETLGKQARDYVNIQLYLDGANRSERRDGREDNSNEVCEIVTIIASIIISIGAIYLILCARRTCYITNNP